MRGQSLLTAEPHDSDVAASVCRAVCGLQAQDIFAAGLGVRVRSRGATRVDVERARFESKSVVWTWLMRGTLHLVATEDLDWLLAALGPAMIRGNAARRAEFGLDEETYGRGLNVVRRYLLEHGAATRRELGAALAAAGLPSGYSAERHLLHRAALEGIVCMGRDRGAEPTFVLLERWLGRPVQTVKPETALAEIVARYLAAYAPATLTDLSTWSGLPVGMLRPVWDAAARERIEVIVQGKPAWMPRERPTEPLPDSSPHVRLLPAFDDYLLGHRDRTLILAKEDAGRILVGGIIQPAILVDGRVAGAWRTNRKGRRVDITQEPFETLTPAVQRQIAGNRGHPAISRQESKVYPTASDFDAGAKTQGADFNFFPPRLCASASKGLPLRSALHRIPGSAAALDTSGGLPIMEALIDLPKGGECDGYIERIRASARVLRRTGSPSDLPPLNQYAIWCEGHEGDAFVCSWPFYFPNRRVPLCQETRPQSHHMEYAELATSRLQKQQKRVEKYLEEKALRQAGLTPPKSKKTPRVDRVRRKDWVSDNLDDPNVYYERDIELEERIVPRGEAERKQAFIPAAVVTANDADAPPIPSAADAGLQATVIEVSSGLCRVRLDGRDLLCEIRQAVREAQSGFTNVVAVGDEVLVSLNTDERGYVEAVLPRRSGLARPDVFNPHLQQIIVANVDQLLIVAAWREPTYWPELVDRYLIAAQRNNLTPIICVNKVDLAEDPAAPRLLLGDYPEMGVRVLHTSASTGEGVAELRRLLRGRTTALAGLSGVGKSSLLSAAEPGLDLKVGEVSDRKHEGRHTTTQVSLHPLADGGYVVDTPGIREFGLSGLAPADLLQYYPDLGFVGQGCRFEDCAHLDEDGCAVRAAVARGALGAHAL